MDYQEFLKQKIKSGKYFGFDIDESEINPMLFPHQKDIVRWCIKGGRRAIFASFGLGKSFMQLEILRLIQKHKSGNQLIIAPLGVIQEFKVDAEKLGININFIRKTEQVTAPGMYITNYESVREEKLDINLFNGVSLDEASCFPAGTLVDTPNGPKAIETIKVGELIYNATGIDIVRETHKNNVKRAIKINIGRHSILTSPDHKFFTRRGWVAAERLQSGDTLMETTETMRLLRGDNLSENATRREEEVLRHILFSEMEGGTTRYERETVKSKIQTKQDTCKLEKTSKLPLLRSGDTSQVIGNGESEVLQRELQLEMVRNSPSAYSRSCKKKRSIHIEVVEKRESRGSETAEKNNSPKPHVKPCFCRKNAEIIKGENVSIKRRKQSIDGTSNISFQNPKQCSDGICNKHCNGKGLFSKPAELLQSGHSYFRQKDSDRSRRQYTQIEKMEILGQEKNCCPESVRVDSIEVLESGHSELERYREADGELYFYDLGSTRHPSYSVNGFLVHNCLRSYGSKTFQTFLTMFDTIPYRFVATATPSPNRFKELIHYSGFLGIMDSGQALAQPLYSKVLTPLGWKKMGDIKEGDDVISSNGNSSKVLSIHPQGKKDVYRVFFSDNSFTDCTEDHLWETQTQYERNAYKKYVKRNGLLGDRIKKYFTIKTTSEIKKTLTCKSTGAKNHSIPIVKPVCFNKKDILFDPYVIGLILGDGHIRKTSITLTSADDWIIEESKKILKKEGLIIYKSGHTRKDNQPNYQYYISTTGKQGGCGYGANKLLAACQKYGLCGKRAWEKSIPDDYKFNTIDIRLSILQGLMDTDGTISKNEKTRTPKFITTSEQLAKDVQEIVRSLGGISNIYNRKGITPSKKEGRLQYHVSIMLPNNINPFRLPRKADLLKERIKYQPIRYITKIEKIGNSDCQCIMIDDPRHLYVTDNYIVTHNTRFFQRDSTKANNLTLYPHKEEEFWLWMHGWAIFLQKPSDLGYSDLGYDLPKLNVHWHCINHRSSFAVDRKTKQVEMFFDPSMSLAGASKEKRESIDIRIEKMKQIIDSEPDNHFIIWHDQEEERHRIKKQIPSCKEVYGSLDLETREQRVIDFSNGKFQYIATKPILSGSGVNWQRHCHNAIYLGIGFKFNDFIQSIHRIYRFQQDKECNIHIIYTSNEKQVVKVLKEKWANHNRMVENMAELIKKHGLSHIDMASELSRSLGVERIEVTGKNFIIANNDCVEETKLIKDNSIGLIVTSIPFSNHYEYTPSFNDFGHTENNEHFWAQMDYLTPELLRVLIPGRIYACHVKDRINFGNVTGAGLPTVSPFHMEAAFHAMKHGFDYCGMITVVTDVVRENNQTYRLGWTEQCKDGSKMGVGSPEYILLFHKPQTDRTRGYSDVPVKKEKSKKHTCPNCKYILKKGESITTEEKDDTFFLDGQVPKWLCNNCNTYQHFIVESEYSRSRWQVDAHAFWRSSGDRIADIEELSSLTPDIISKVFQKYDMENIYDYETHVKIGENLDLKGCLPSSFMCLAPSSKDPMVWTDINRMLTLNGSQSRKGLALHVCPLQTDIVDRLITRYSNKKEWVYDPFGGLGTVPSRAVSLGRKGRSSELNSGYFLDSVKYLQAAEVNHKTPSLFDFIEAQI